jgi:preprotein translocase subunit YajC
MNTFILPLLMAAPQQSAEGGGGSVLMTFFPFILIIAIFYFLIIRPQNKKRKETEKMLAAIKKGDKIITIGGLYGTVTNVKEKTIIIKVDDNVKLEFLRSAVSSVEVASKEEKIEDKSYYERPDDQSSESSSTSGE